MAELAFKQLATRVGVLIGGVIVLFLVAQSVTKNEVERVRASAQPTPQEDRAKQSAWIAEMQLRVKARLKDPASAQFRNVQFSRSSGAPVVCGEVNSNNGFGGKAGFQRFIASGNIIAIEEQMAQGEMDKTWIAICG